MVRPYRRLPPGHIKILNLVPTQAQIADGAGIGSAWAKFWHDMRSTWNTPVIGAKAQIDFGIGLGCNTVRIIGDGGGGVFSGIYSLAEYLAAQDLVIRYCQSRGLYFYVTIGGAATYQGYRSAPGGDGTATGFGAIANFAAATAGRASQFPNVIGADVCQECTAVTLAPSGAMDGQTTITPDQLDTMLTQVYAAIRAVAPGLALTSSDTQNFGFDASCWTDQRMTRYDYLKDFKDMHVYYTPGPGDAAAGMATPGCQGKQLLVGEFGRPQSEPDNRITQMDAVKANILGDSRTRCAGLGLWAAIPQDTPGSNNDWGLQDLQGNIRPAGTHFANLTSARRYVPDFHLHRLGVA